MKQFFGILRISLVLLALLIGACSGAPAATSVPAQAASSSGQIAQPSVVEFTGMIAPMTGDGSVIAMSVDLPSTAGENTNASNDNSANSNDDNDNDNDNEANGR